MRHISYLTVLCSLTFLIACSDNVIEPSIGSGGGNTDTEFWTGPNIQFTKESDSDANSMVNQDRLTNTVWITRSTSGGQIFNIKTENSAAKDESPAGTLWAIGNIADASTLTFTDFRGTVGSPWRVMRIPLVVKLEEDNIIFSLTFTSWDTNMGGGFSYIRSTPP